MEQPSINLLDKMLSSGNREMSFAAVNICGKIYIPQAIIRRWMLNPEVIFREAAMVACRNQHVEWDIIESGLRDSSAEVKFLAADICKDIYLPWEFVKELIEDDDEYYRIAGFNALRHTDIPLEDLKSYLYSDKWQTRDLALEGCEGREIPEDVMWSMLMNLGTRSYDIQTLTAVASHQRRAAEYLDYAMEHYKNREWSRRIFEACKDAVLPLDMINKWLDKEDRYASTGAAMACRNTYIPYSYIASWMDEGLIYYRLAAIAACLKNPSLDILDRGLNDEDHLVRAAAMSTMRDLGLRVPPCRVVEPPDIVYKKCINNVIVTARIPKDAQIRGNYFEQGKYRSDKAEILDIYGEVCGEKIGISKYDPTTIYLPGDFVHVTNFDYGHIECSQGFHFFLTKKEAREFRP